MNWGDIKGLMGAYSMEVQAEEPEQNKVRFSGRGTFIDVWRTRKGITLGVYNPEVKACYYRRNMSAEKIEDILLALPNND